MINHLETKEKKKPARSEDVAGSSWSAQSLLVLEIHRDLANEVASVVRVRNVGASGQVVVREPLLDGVGDFGAVDDPRTPFLIVHHQNSVVVVLGVRRSTLDVDFLAHHSRVLGRTECREEAEIDQSVRELAGTHRAPPFRHLAGFVLKANPQASAYSIAYCYSSVKPNRKPSKMPIFRAIFWVSKLIKNFSVPQTKPPIRFCP